MSPPVWPAADHFLEGRARLEGQSPVPTSRTRGERERGGDGRLARATADLSSVLRRRLVQNKRGPRSTRGTLPGVRGRVPARKWPYPPESPHPSPGPSRKGFSGRRPTAAILWISMVEKVDRLFHGIFSRDSASYRAIPKEEAQAELLGYDPGDVARLNIAAGMSHSGWRPGEECPVGPGA